MKNTTSRLAVRIQNYPPFPFQWNDATPQKSRGDLDEKDIVASDEVGVVLRSHMLTFMKTFMVQELISLSDLAQFIPSSPPLPANKSEILPLKLLFRDEKYIDENIQILLQYMKETSSEGSPQVIIVHTRKVSIIMDYLQCMYTV